MDPEHKQNVIDKAARQGTPRGPRVDLHNADFARVAYVEPSREWADQCEIQRWSRASGWVNLGRPFNEAQVKVLSALLLKERGYVTWERWKQLMRRIG